MQSKARVYIAADQWRCFHCDEVFTDRQSAQDHFGLDDIEPPACIQVLTEGERAIVEDRRHWRNRALAAESEAEQKAYEAHLLTFDLSWSRQFRGARSLNEAFHVFDAMEGRALAAEAALDAAPRWLANWLRRRSERLATKDSADA